jgi:hypothetical protein
MAHIHTEPGQHDPTASAFIIRLDTKEPTLLLHKHRLLGKYLQFGGHVELHEHRWSAVTHEIREESGYDMGQLKLLQPVKRIKYLSGAVLHPIAVCSNTHKIEEGHFHTDDEYVFVTYEDPAYEIDSGESRVIKGFTARELANLNDDETYANIREIGAFIFDTCLSEWETVDPVEFSILSTKTD